MFREILQTETFKYVQTHNTNMGNMTLSVPEKLHKEMAVHSEIKWSDVARKAFEKKIKELNWMDKVLSKSKLTQEDANRIGHKIKGEMAKRFR
jgi:ABC-type oligopeptide transport system ATPase subunit